MRIVPHERADPVRPEGYQPCHGTDPLRQVVYDKLWDDHVVATDDDGQTLLYVDRQLLHEVSSPQALLLGQNEIARIRTRFAPAIATFEAAQRRISPWLWSNDIG